MLRRRRTALGIVPGVTALAIGPLTAWTSAAAAPAVECSIRPNGSNYLISGSGFEPGKAVNFYRNGQPIGGGTVPADGTYSVGLRPDQGAPGAGVGFFAKEGLEPGGRATTCTIIDAPSACDGAKAETTGYRLGRTEGLKDGREDGFADTYRKSYDDAVKKRPGLTADECKAVQDKGFADGYKVGYEEGFKEGKAKGGKVGKKEGEEDRRKGNASRNVVVSQLQVKADPASGEADCAQGIRFTATLVGSGTGTVRYHWERTSGKVSGTVEFAGDGTKTVTDQAAVPAGSATATVSQKFVVDSGPSQGKTGQASASVTCKK
ncbi:hypothetical protein [Streptomyces sp. NPDC031705]|uniref:hypothetical protein n=1 Tax=Streptomyces sp. NPDC031705 TaxID=3155729 RepID=UPI0033DA9D48